ncbi:PPOX class F420-dependent oxidoreductase [Saccharomonospora cyanea]|uniref:PPOX class probable F420-dependent enzyme n=1 Tax=Saccharomonospora cyanea NA-134 TaxID=882082 RepID=H5XFA6_9PSEU|nr:PPOX class F420-dependent oxidoreductase [Saccharomonospora cyanea]EHR62529.1 PPOX class probable F420-dependent enzyme [Saccharomonospora cyanea NA-134]
MMRMDTESELARLDSEKYVSLVTFRRTGVGVATPVWIARDGDELLVFSERHAGKVKRIRNDPRVELTACDVRGRRTHGATVTGKARVLDDEGSAHARRVIARRYGLVGRLTMFFSRLRGGPRRTVGIAIALAD